MVTLSSYFHLMANVVEKRLYILKVGVDSILQQSPVLTIYLRHWNRRSDGVP